VFGLVSVAERVWRTQQKNYLRLLPEAIGVTPRGRSQRLERVLTDFGSEHSFQHAVKPTLLSPQHLSPPFSRARDSRVPSAH